MRSTTTGKAQHEAWDITMREEVGIVRKGAQKTVTKRLKTRSAKERSSSKRQNVHGGVSELQFKRISRLERLELTNAWDPLERTDDQYHDDGGSSDEERRRRKVDRKSNKRQIFLADVLAAEGNCDFIKATARKSKRPCPDRVCDVTGKVGRYCDPVTGLFVHDRKALLMLQEQVPGWLKAIAISPFWDTITSLQSEDKKRTKSKD